MSLLPEEILVPYGVDTWSVQTINVRRFGDGSIEPGTPFPCVAINKATRRPLRLNSEALNPAPNFNAPQGATPLNLIKDRLKSFCRPWDGLSLQFLDGYFEHIANMLRVHQDAITAKLAPFVGLYAAEDWAFSAPKPLPRAHLYASRNAGSAGWDIDNFVQVDFAFWLGDRVVAVLSQPEVLTPARAAERLARLEQAGVIVVHFSAENLARSPTALFHRVIGDFGALLDSAGTVPVGPFRPQGLGDH
jgi:hypothetical protein